MHMYKRFITHQQIKLSWIRALRTNKMQRQVTQSSKGPKRFRSIKYENHSSYAHVVLNRLDPSILHKIVFCARGNNREGQNDQRWNVELLQNLKDLSRRIDFYCETEYCTKVNVRQRSEETLQRQMFHLFCRGPFPTL